MITVCGEALVDLVTTDGRTFEARPGGGPANVAVGLARLGVPVSLLGRIAGDTFGRLVESHLRANGVDLRDVARAAESTTLAVASLDATGGAAYDFYVERTADFGWTDDALPDPLAPDVEALSVGSLVAAVGPGAPAVEEMLRREHARGVVTTVLDPNIRPALAGEHADTVARVERQVALCDLVKASDQDLAYLYPDADPERVARDWLAAGPALVVITLGAQGVLAVGAGDRAVVRVPARPVTVADTVGAGDAYLAGLLAGLRADDVLDRRRGLPTLAPPHLVSLLERANAVAAVTASRPGADPPTAAEVGW